MTVVGKAKPVEERNANIIAFFLHPCIRPDFTADLLIHGAWIVGFGKLVRHGATKHELPTQATRLHLNGNADIEAASQPPAGRRDDADIGVAEVQVLFGDSRDRVSRFPELSIEGRVRCNVGRLMNNVLIILDGRLVGDGAAE